MTEKEQIARIVLDLADGATAYSGAGCYTFDIDLGNFSNNTTEVVYLEFDYLTPLFMLSQASPVQNDRRSIELLLDVPQFNSYDSTTQSQTHHLCFLDRDYGQIASTTYTAGTDNSNDPTTWQVWKLGHKPQRIPVKPEVLQQKRWNLRLQFVNNNATTLVTDTSAQYALETVPKLVLSVTK